MPKLAFLLHRKPNQPVIAGTTRNTSFFESQREERFLVATLLERTGIVRGAPGPPTVNCKLLTVNCALMDKLTGIHAVKEALEAQRPIDLIVLLDGVEDPHNLGAIVRTALAAGAHGVVIPERRAAGLTDTVARSSAGALAHLPVAKVTNLARAMEELKKAGYWLVGLDERADKVYTEIDYKPPVGIVFGSEGQGLHELTRKRCDFVVSLPTTGPVKSLNVSVATGVVLFEAIRQ